MRYLVLVVIILSMYLCVNAQTAFSELAESYAKAGNYEEAIRLEKEGIDILVNTGFKNSLLYAYSLDNLATYNYDLGEYNSGLSYSLEALRIIEGIMGKENEHYARCLNTVSLIYSSLGYREKAEEYGSLSLILKEKTLGKEHPDYISSLSNLVIYKISMGEYSKAIEISNDALPLIEKVYGKYHLNYCLALRNLAVCYSYLGNYVESIKLIKLALEIQEKVHGKENLEYLKSLNNLSTYYFWLGNFKEAIEIEENIIEWIKLNMGLRTPFYATSLNSLAVYYYASHNYEKAIQISMECRKVFEEINGMQYPEFSKLLGNLSEYYLLNGNLNEAIQCGEEALELKGELFGEHSPEYSQSLASLSRCYFALKDYDNSIKFIKRACKIIEDILGPFHPYYTSYIIMLSTLYYKFQNFYELESLTLEISNNLEKQIMSNFVLIPSFDRITYWDAYKQWYNSNLLIYSYGLSTNSLIQNSYNGILLSKGILLNSEIEFEKFLAETGDEALLGKYNDIKNLRLQLNKLYEKPIAERYVDTDSLERQANELERQLMQESAEFGDYTRNLTITWEDVRDNLKEKDAAIEFVHFPLNNDSTMYMAYVLRTNMEAPELVKLFEEKDLTSLYPKNKPENVYQKKKASSMIWGALAPTLDGVENIYFAPDGVLHQIAIEYFKDFENAGLIADRYNLYRLSSTRQIAMKQPAKLSDRAVIYGGIQYDTDPDTMKIESAKYFPTKRGYTSRYNTADSISVRSRQGYLEHTLTEAQSLKTLFNDNNQHPTLFIGNEASEESFKSLSGQHNYIIHIATHGFYWDESYAEYVSSKNERLLFMSQFGDNARRNVEDKALTRTGLYMAGANNALNGDSIPEGVDDGILTAQEIANLDLRGLDLVVLSACQTGMGDIRGDGVFGLQRGFKKAGANTILMSLWDVDDAATQILMTNFYKNLMNGQSKHESLRNAQKAVREFDGEINGKRPDFSAPKYWAAFILLDALD